MNAWLFEAECSAEGELYKYRTMLMRSKKGIFEILDGVVDYYVICRSIGVIFLDRIQTAT